MESHEHGIHIYKINTIILQQDTAELHGIYIFANHLKTNLFFLSGKNFYRR